MLTIAFITALTEGGSQAGLFWIFSSEKYQYSVWSFRDNMKLRCVVIDCEIAVSWLIIFNL